MHNYVYFGSNPCVTALSLIGLSPLYMFPHTGSQEPLWDWWQHLLHVLCTLHPARGSSCSTDTAYTGKCQPFNSSTGLLHLQDRLQPRSTRHLQVQIPFESKITFSCKVCHSLIHSLTDPLVSHNFTAPSRLNDQRQVFHL